jgi:uncharacterized Zn finger protein (UPF0148 family)
MSDFDREAEREKLREKYERDKEKREASERMSELLLQGATMTNRHCPACQSPVFRYEGRSFCPTCEREVTEDGELRGGDEPADAEAETETEANAGESADADAEPTADRAGDDAAAGSETETDGRTGAQSGTATDRTPEPVDEGDRETDEERAEPTESAPPAPSRDRRPARVDPPATSDAEPPAGRSGSDADAGSGERNRTRSPAGGPRSERGSLQETERTLVEEVASLTRRAEGTRDVGRKRELLAAAREAAETLETVRRL